MQWQPAVDIKKKVSDLILKLKFKHVQDDKVFCFRGHGSKARAYARIWSLPKIWQQALNLAPSYVIEVIAEKFDRLNPEKQTEVLIHELLHIPQNFSGALRPHRTRYFRLDRKKVISLINQFKIFK